LTAVRQQPFTATLSPVFKRRATARADTVSRMDFFPGSIFFTVPVSWMIPVNMA
jgi:hypothetical protein